jgi:hypothetical protein
MVNPPYLRSAISPRTPDLPVLQILIFLVSESPMYLNSHARKKLQVCEWLISATPPEFNQLQRIAWQAGCGL